MALVIGGLPIGPVWSADIRATPHNLTRKGALVEADEVCIFCHTPLLPKLEEGGGNQASRPVWQRSLPEGHSFILYDDIGRSRFGDKPSVGSQSIACLSCHDANQAFSVTASQSDHPFGIPYRGFSREWKKKQDAEAQSGNAPSRSAYFLTHVDDFRRPSNGTVENRSAWWVSSTGVNAVRTRADLPLYPRQSPNGEVPYVECSSCHDPHVARPLFLRVSNEGSKLCLTCHDK